MIKEEAKKTRSTKKATAPAKKKNPTVKKITVKETESVPVIETGEELYLAINGKKKLFSVHTSPIYGVNEYYFEGNFGHGDSIRFVRENGHEVPVHHTPNCGYTLVGKAQRLFSASKALIANGEAGDDQEYVYINDHSSLSYIGEDGTHTLFIRIYDNLNNINNDRWVVISID
ncbi:MAG: hypothetical protein WCR67_02045 [Bacilli bacterium]